jgi:hypothetical protein
MSKKVSERNIRLVIAMMRSMASCKPISPFHLSAADDMEKMLKEIITLRKQPKEKSVPTLEHLMEKGVTRFLDGKEVTLGYTDAQMRIGWVWKDTGLPANKEKRT